MAEDSLIVIGKRMIRTALIVVSLAGWICSVAEASGPSAEAGKKKFQSSICVQCHGLAGQGVPTMGIDLRTAPLIKEGKLDKIDAFIASGHGATKEFPAGMPADGGVALTEADRRNIATWLVEFAK